MADIIKDITCKIDVEIPPVPLPDALTTLGVTSLGNQNDLRLAWIDPGVLATSYDIEYSNNPAFPGGGLTTSINIPATPAAPGSSDFIGLSPMMYDYYFRIRAVNASGTSAWATIAFPIPTPDDLINLVVTPVSANQIDLDWDDPGYWGVDVEVDWAGAPFNTNPIYSSATQPATPLAPGNRSIGGLVAATTYYFRIRSKNGAISSGPTLGSGTTL